MTRRFWAPGRVNLIGDHTDLVGGLVLPVALDLGIRLDAVASAETAIVSADAADATGWRRYVDAVAAELDVLGRPHVGVMGELRSTLPIRAGLASSAALEVVIALALCAVADFELPPLELAQAARRAEHRAVGVPCGLMDHAACLLGRAGHALLLNTGTLEYEHVPLPPGLAVVIVDSGIGRQLMPARVRDVESENRRVRAAAAALRADDRAQLGETFRDGHELDRLVELAEANGAFAARMAAGAIVALVDDGAAAAFADAMAAHGRTWVCRASEGAREL